MLKSNRLYKHKRGIDAAIYVIEALPDSVYRVEWYNTTYHRFMSEFETFTILDAHNWEDITDNEIS